MFLRIMQFLLFSEVLTKKKHSNILSDFFCMGWDNTKKIKSQYFYKRNVKPAPAGANYSDYTIQLILIFKHYKNLRSENLF